GGELEGALAQSLVELAPVIYGDDNVRIRLTLDDNKADDLTDNQGAVVDAAVGNPLVEAAVQSPDYAHRLDHLSGEIHASTQTALLDSAALMQRTLAGRMRGHIGVDQCLNAPVAARPSPDNRSERKPAAC